MKTYTKKLLQIAVDVDSEFCNAGFKKRSQRHDTFFLFLRHDFWEYTMATVLDKVLTRKNEGIKLCNYIYEFDKLSV